METMEELVQIGTKVNRMPPEALSLPQSGLVLEPWACRSDLEVPQILLAEICFQLPKQIFKPFRPFHQGLAVISERH
jgi:hypothetical protein